jgi:hypothetical protein
MHLEIDSRISHDRIRDLSPKLANERIDKETERIIRGLQTEGDEAVIERLKELDREWDIDRVLMLNFSVLVFFQLVLARKNKKWLWGPLIQTPFLFMHATLGWCPPSLWFRPLGFRTRQEIQAERETLLEYLKQLPD